VRYARPYVPFYTVSKIFVPFGELESVAILKPKDSTRTQTCGFVRFASVADAARAIRDLNGKHIVDSVCTPPILICILS
jgi:RNA recognition motif-containing protein